MNRSSKIASRVTAAFTIVELTVVIIVVAILAGLVVVGYNGVTKNAKATAVKSDLQQAMTKLGVNFAKNGSYPEDFSGDAALVSSNTNFTYTRANNENFCLTGVSSEFDTVVFHIDQDKVLREGYCDVHQPTPLACFAFDSGTGTITDYYDNESNSPSNPVCPKNVNIPAEISGVTVSSVGDSAFYGNQLTSISIPNTVTNLGMYSFRANQLTSIIIPNQVTSIGAYAFYMNQLESVLIPNSVTTIGMSAFQGNKLSSVVVPSSLTTIEHYAFRDNELTSVTIPSSVTDIKSYAFYNNKLGPSVSIPDSVTAIGNYAFANNMITYIFTMAPASIGTQAFRATGYTSVCYFPVATSITSGACNSTYIVMPP